MLRAVDDSLILRPLISDKASTMHDQTYSHLFSSVVVSKFINKWICIKIPTV